MDILLVHQFFPGQFVHLAKSLPKLGHRVIGLGMIGINEPEFPGIQYIKYSASRSSSKDIHPWAQDHEAKVIRGDACFKAAKALRQQGFSPKIILAHVGWGEALFLKEVWPQARLGGYCELFHGPYGLDMDFDPDVYPTDDAERCRILSKTSTLLLSLQQCDAILCPTIWQSQSLPEELHHKVSVIHDGIDTENLVANRNRKVRLSSNEIISCSDEVVTYISRNLEPYRGFHMFMRSLPDILESRQNAIVLIVGAEGPGYGPPHPSGQSWKQLLLTELKGLMSEQQLSRIHFLGQVAFSDYKAILQVSSVHVYLTYPYILSWSLLEAMSCECAIVSNNTPPVLEVIEPNVSGRLVDFFDTEQLSKEVIELLRSPLKRMELGELARQRVLSDFDLRSNCLPKRLAWIKNLAHQ